MQDKARTSARPGWVLFLLTLIYMSNSMDRHIVAILAEPIRIDLNLSDTQLGLLSGLIFALFYTVFGVPVGWLADRVGKTRVIFAAATVWSICSALGALSVSFGQLAAARIGVAIGEAGGSAPSYSLLSSVYPPNRRGAVLGLFHLGSPIGTLIAAFGATWVTLHFGWRAAIVAVSAPGAIFALILLLTVREPRRERSAELAGPGFGEALRRYFNSPILVLAGVAAGASSFTTGAMAAWIPAFLMRVRQMPLEAVGSWYAICNAVAFGFGIWFGGYLADRYADRGLRAYAYVPCAGLAVAIPMLALACLLPSWRWSMLVWMIPIASVGMFLAPAVALVQNIVAAEERAVSGGIFLLFNYLIGGGLGPLYVGAISDWMHASQGNASLFWGLIACIPVLALAIALQLVLARLLSAVTASAG